MRTYTASRAIAPVLAAALITAAPLLSRAQPAEVGLQARLETHVRYLAGDPLEGRLVGTPGIHEAARYIAGEFESAGLVPVADTSFFQEFSLSLGCETVSAPEMTIGERKISYGDEFREVPLSGSGRLESLTAFISETDEEQVHLDVPRDMKGWAVFCAVNTEVERNRWTLKGRDGLLEWMRAIAKQVSGFGASAVIFVTGGPDAPPAELHFFPMSRSYEPLPIPVLEIAYPALEEALMFEGITLKGLAGGWQPGPDSAGGLAGRGTSGSDSTERMSAGGRPGPDSGLERSFVLDGPLCRIVIETGPRAVSASNVVGLVRGGGREDEYVIVGAHYDHLGYGDIASSTPWRREIHNGADDNASGVAALIETAKAISAARELDRSVLFIAFTAEELGAIGSRYYRDNPLRPIDGAVTMVNLDTVGRLEDGKLIVFGARSATEFEGLLAEVNEAYSLEVIPKEEIFGYSDQNAFVEAGIPSLHFFTGAHGDYHSPDDDWQNLDYEGLEAVTSFVTDFVVTVANGETAPTPLEGLGERTERPSSRGAGAHLGIIPDFTHSGEGVRIRGTMPQSPAEASGLQEGDVIAGIDAEAVSELGDLMRILSMHKPGDLVEIEVKRDSKTLLIPVELGVRRSGGHGEERD